MRLLRRQQGLAVDGPPSAQVGGSRADEQRCRRPDRQNVIKYGAGADLLIHEVAIAPPALLAEPFIQRIMAHHTTASEAGRVFAQARPKLAAYTHLVFLASAQIPPATVDDLLTETRRTYDGPLVAGEDLMQFAIGDAVTLRRFAGAESK